MIRFALIIALVCTVADQATKLTMLQLLADFPHFISVLPFLEFRLAFNPGISFSFFSQSGDLGRWLLSGIALVVVAALLWLLSREQRWFYALGTGLIVGGAIGNVIDRVRIGAVVDFISVQLGSWYFPTFNVADSVIFLGVVCLLIDMVFGHTKQQLS